MAGPTHYEVLGVSPAASAEEIKKSFRDLARRHHPDVSPGKTSEDRFRQINAAYQVLSDSNKRALYDSELKLLALKTPRPSPGPSSAQRPSSQHRGSSSTQSKTGQRTAQGGGSTSRPSAIDSLLDQATTAFRKMRYREAEMICRQILRMDRRSVSAYEILGDIHKARGRTDEAVAMYSYVLQLDRGNATVRTKFDRLVGSPSGPTMAGHAASTSRRRRVSRGDSNALAQNAQIRGLLCLAGIALIAITFVAATGSQSEPTRSFSPFEWDVRLIGCLAVLGGVSGALLSMSGVLARFRDEMSISPENRRGVPVPLGSILIGFAALFFYASLLAYVIIGCARKSLSRSIVSVYGATLMLLVAVSLILPASATHLLAMGGNIIFLALMLGWMTGDAVLGT